MDDEVPDEPIEYRAVYDKDGDVILNIGEGRWQNGGWCGDWPTAWRAFGPLRFALPGPVVGAGRKLLIEKGRRQVLDAIRARADEIDKFSFINPPDAADCDEADAFRRAAAFAEGAADAD